MKTIFCVLLSFCFLTSMGQQKKTVEFSTSINTVDPLIPLGNYYFAVPSNSGEGIYSDKSLATGITAKFFLKDDLAFRLKTIYTKRNLNFHDDGPLIGNAIEDIHNMQSIFKIAPGIQWSFPLKQFSFWAGIEIPLSIIGSMTETTHILSKTSIGTNDVNRTYTIPGGSSFGIGIFTGSQYNLSKHLALGLELGTAYERTKIGGTLVRHQVVTGPVNSDNTDQTTGTFDQTKFIGLQGSIQLIYHFK